MVDTVLEYAMEERWDSSVDQHLVVRETPAAKVRENIARIKREILRAKLEKELDAIHQAEHLDDALPPAVESVKAPWREKWDAFWDAIGVSICRYAHRFPETVKGSDNYLTCIGCGRKYALPWADPKKLPADVYTYSGFVTPTEPTRQVELRSKAHARIVT